MPNYQGKGVYQHYKGGFYLVTGRCTPEWLKEEGEPVKQANVYVTYEPLSAGSILDSEPDIEAWLRPLNNFNEMVEVSPEMPLVPRFQKVKA